MAEFREAVLTRKGIALLAKMQSEKTVFQITKAVTGNGEYEDGEDLAAMTALKNQKQEFAPTTIKRQNDTNVFVGFSITNFTEKEELAHGYYVTEIGLVAADPDEGEILYAIAVGIHGRCDYLQAYNSLLPAVIDVEFLIEVGNAENVIIKTDLAAYAKKSDLDLKGDAIEYDGETGELLLKSGKTVISKTSIGIPGAVTALEGDVRTMAMELMKSLGGEIETGTRTATSGEIQDVISGLDRIL